MTFQHRIMLRRNLLYTAVTRAKNLVVLVGQRRALERAIDNDEDVQAVFEPEKLAGSRVSQPAGIRPEPDTVSRRRPPVAGDRHRHAQRDTTDMPTYEFPDLAPMLTPRSVAVIGAVPEQHRAGGRPIPFSIAGGFQGPMYAVNPRRSEIDGRPCYASLADLPETPELAVITVRDSLAAEALRDCGRRGGPCRRDVHRRISRGGRGWRPPRAGTDRDRRSPRNRPVRAQLHRRGQSPHRTDGELRIVAPDPANSRRGRWAS